MISNAMRMTLFLAALAFFGNVYAVQDVTKTLNRLGVQTQLTPTAPDVAYFDFVEAMGFACLGGVIYVPLNLPFGRAAYAKLLSAKMFEKRVSVIYDTTTAPNGGCQITAVEVN